MLSFLFLPTGSEAAVVQILGFSVKKKNHTSKTFPTQITFPYGAQPHMTTKENQCLSRLSLVQNGLSRLEKDESTLHPAVVRPKGWITGRSWSLLGLNSCLTQSPVA
ncbi:hypothetical protein E2320_005595 [Naja naja]|nr:hypothetical protein E2320_005595 [Naja naja]